MAAARLAFRYRFPVACGYHHSSDWHSVELGFENGDDFFFCICCRTFQGEGRRRHSDRTTLCVPCWQHRERGEQCDHEMLP